MKKFIAFIIIALIVVIVIGRCAATNRNNQIILNEHKNQVVTDTVVSNVIIDEYLYDITDDSKYMVDGKPVKAADLLSIIEGYKVIEADSTKHDTEEDAYGLFRYITSKCSKIYGEGKAYLTEQGLVEFRDGTICVTHTPYDVDGAWYVKQIIYKPE